MKNDLQEIHRMTDFVEQFGSRHHLGHNDIFALTLCIEELITNTIRYGYPEHEVHEMTLDLRVQDGICHALLDDGALPFNPLQRPDVDLSRPLEEKPIGGLGIHLVKKMMDQVDYRHHNGRNILTLQRRIGRDENPPGRNRS